MLIPWHRFSIFNGEYTELFGDTYGIDGDFSTSALLKAIALKHALNSDPEGKVSESLREVKVKTVRATSDREIEYYLTDEHISMITVVECSAGLGENAKIPEGWKAQFTLNDKPFPINQYLSQFVRTRILLNPAKKKLVALVEKKVSSIWAQALNSVLCRLLTWYFPQDIPAEEQAFFKSISVDNKSISPEEKELLVIKYVEDSMKSADVRKMVLHKYLDGLTDLARTSKISDLDRKVVQINRNIEDYTTELGRLYNDLNQYVTELTILKTTPPEDSDELFNFFYKHKQLKVVGTEDSNLTFGVVDTLEFYDEDEFERIYDNKNSFLARYGDRFRSAIKAIFSERKGVIRTCANFSLKGLRLVAPLSRSLCESNAMPNPHIYYYACSGGHEQYYSLYAKSGDWDLGIEQAIAATKNLNWGDLTVCERMTQWFLDSCDVPCIYVNSELSPIEKVTEDMELISFNQFADLVYKKKGDEANG